MWRIFTILVLVLSIGVCTALAQQRQHKKHGPPKQGPNIEEIFKAKDKDHDGKLSKEEFIGKAAKDTEHAKLLEKRFKVIDANSDGYITLDELKAAHEKMGKQKAQHQIKRPPQKAKVALMA